MTLPDNFSPAEHLQDLLKRTVNKEVREWFRDVGPDEWDPDITTPRSSLRVGCTHAEADSFDMTLGRLLLFYMVCKKAADMHPELYTMPVEAYQASRNLLPQISLNFYEPADEVDAEYPGLEGRISFRTDETIATLTQADLERYANRIVTQFPESFRWKKGKVGLSYTDKAKGYQLWILAYTESEGREVIGKVLALKGDTIDNSKLNVGNNQNPGSAFPTIPDRTMILGKSVRLPRRRPVGNVRLRTAFCMIPGLRRSVVLVDRTGRYPSALETR